MNRLLTYAVIAEPRPHSAIRKRGQSNFRDEAPRKKTLTPFASVVIADNPVTSDQGTGSLRPTPNPVIGVSVFFAAPYRENYADPNNGLRRTKVMHQGCSPS